MCVCFLEKGGGLFGARGWEFSSIISTASAFLSSSSDRRASVSPPLGDGHSYITPPKPNPLFVVLSQVIGDDRTDLSLSLPEVTVSHADKAVRFLAAGSSRRGRTISKVVASPLCFNTHFCRSVRFFVAPGPGIFFEIDSAV